MRERRTHSSPILRHAAHSTSRIDHDFYDVTNFGFHWLTLLSRSDVAATSRLHKQQVLGRTLDIFCPLALSVRTLRAPETSAVGMA